jgi:hypothetical protein
MIGMDNNLCPYRQDITNLSPTPEEPHSYMAEFITPDEVPDTTVVTHTQPVWVNDSDMAIPNGAVIRRTTMQRTLWPEIARRLVRGESQSAIARALGRSVSMICNTVGHGDFQPVLKSYQDMRDKDCFDVLEHFKAYTEAAASKVTELVDDSKAGPAIQFAAAREVLRQAGYGLTPKVQITNIDASQSLTYEQRLEKAEQLAISEGEVVDDTEGEVVI